MTVDIVRWKLHTSKDGWAIVFTNMRAGGVFPETSFNHFQHRRMAAHVTLERQGKSNAFYNNLLSATAALLCEAFPPQHVPAYFTHHFSQVADSAPCAKTPKLRCWGKKHMHLPASNSVGNQHPSRLCAGQDEPLTPQRLLLDLTLLHQLSSRRIKALLDTLTLLLLGVVSSWAIRRSFHFPSPFTWPWFGSLTLVVPILQWPCHPPF